MASPEDAKFTNQDIYLSYIDLKHGFGSIDHVQVLPWNYLQYKIMFICSIYIWNRKEGKRKEKPCAKEAQSCIAWTQEFFLVIKVFEFS
jgi:hypothetical protein